MVRLINIFTLAAALAALSPGIRADAPSATRQAGDAPAATAALLASPDLKSQFWFGVAVENIPPPIARQLKLKPSQGLMVSAVLPNSPAGRAGLKPDDLLIEINDGPLTSQDDLFRAANSLAQDRTQLTARPSRLVYLREGDRVSVEITPALRPQNMIVFDGGAGSGDGSHHITVRNYVAPTGGGAQVATGYRINLAASDPGDFTAKSIRAIVSRGQTVILSQETDVAGNVKYTITVGSTVYEVDPLHLDALPADLRPLAQELIGGSASAEATAPAPAPAPSLEQRVKELEAQNAQLQRQVQRLLEHEKPAAKP